MYVVQGKYWIVRNGVKVPPPEPVRFHTAMGMLRWALDTGMIRRCGAWGNTVPGPAEMERVSIPYAGSGDWSGDWFFSPEQVAAMGRALSRYRAHLRYRREVEPQWRPDTSVSATGEVFCADNSIELHEVDKDGNKRVRQTVPPHGDVCF